MSLIIPNYEEIFIELLSQNSKIRISIKKFPEDFDNILKFIFADKKSFHAFMHFLKYVKNVEFEENDVIADLNVSLKLFRILFTCGGRFPSF